ncbi:MAG: hypothetical protein Q9226_005383 [Calogaya cf. arnoldii]
MDSQPVRAPEGDISYSELFDAARSGNIIRLEAALTPLVNVDAVEACSAGAPSRACLHIVSAAGNLEAIRVLLSKGADIGIRDVWDETPLHHAAYNVQYEAVKLLLDGGAQPDAKSARHQFGSLDDRLITEAVNRKSLDLTRICLERGALIPDDLLSEVHNYEIGELLLVHGATITSSKKYTRSAIITASQIGNVKLLLMYLYHAQDTDIAASLNAIHHAADFGYLEIVDVLVENGMSVKAPAPYPNKTYYGDIPLTSACRTERPNLEMIKKLLEHGADLQAHDTKGSTPLHLAAWSCDPEIVEC